MSYRELIRTKGPMRVLGAQTLARFVWGMFSILMVLHIERHFHNYTAAGLVLAAVCVGQAVMGPVLPRLMVRFGMPLVLAILSIITGVCLLILAVALPPLEWTLLVALIAGLTCPPYGPATRTIYPKIVPGRLLSPLYALDAAAQEIIWIMGPVVAVLASLAWDTTVGLLIGVGIFVVGSLWFIFNPETRQVRIPPARRKLGGVLKRPTVILATAINFALIAGFSAMETGIIAAFGDGSAKAGIVLALFSVGSLIGSIVLGHRPLTKWHLAMVLSINLLGVALCLFSTDMLWMCIVLTIGGAGVAPALSALNVLISSTVKFSETAEAFGWSITGQLIGAALGAAIAGILIDNVGAIGAFGAAVAFMVMTLILTFAGSKIIPDLRGKDASPLPDTETISLPVIG